MQVDCQEVLNCQNEGEFFLSDYMMKLGNFDQNHLETLLNCEGYYDAYNADKQDLIKTSFNKIVDFRSSGIKEETETITSKEGVTSERKWRWYEFCFSPNIGFLADTLPLITDTEVQICFERAKPEVALIELDDDMELEYIELIDCKAQTEYVSSPSLRAYFQTIQTNPIVYEFDNIDVMTKPMSVTDTIVRVDHIRFVIG